MRRTLQPLYANPVFIGSQAFSATVLAAGLFLGRLRKKRLNDPTYARARASKRKVRRDVEGMDHCLAAGDAEGFLHAACSAVRQRLGERWDQAPEAVSAEDIRRRLDGRGAELSRLFDEAHAASYSGRQLSRDEMKQWRETVVKELDRIEAT
jgi:hypothetical protein